MLVQNKLVISNLTGDEMRRFLLTALLAEVIFTFVAFKVEAEPGRLAQTSARDFPRAAAQTATWTHTFQKTCDTDWCIERVVFPLMISKKKEAPPGSVKMTYTILPSQPRNEDLFFLFGKRDINPANPWMGTTWCFGTNLI